MATTSTPAWRKLLEAALEANKQHKFSTFHQLATVRQDGRPANRTMAHRGFVADTNKIQWFTDNRSNKMPEIEHCPWGEICWYFVDSREQFRLLGQLRNIAPGEEDPELAKLREEAWQSASTKQRAQFANPPPSEPRAPDDAFPKDLDEDIGPLDAFGLLTLDPVVVDYVALRENKRKTFTKDDEQSTWKEEEVNP